ncbi:hypothetical protein SLS53_003060 [Cytospora paraplurivora]|uniref:Uncharacterized protein n=1 Tax=Cytospora paraplurivora TaxID=2898453 RepID=A0AAN9UCH5_9PEZI
MKNFFSILAAIMGGLMATASGIKAPIDGYAVVNITWNLQSNISGFEPINVTGTVQDAWKVINYTWPGYPLPVLNATGHGNVTGPGPRPTSTTANAKVPTGVREDEASRETGTVNCYTWPEANEGSIADGIDYLSLLPGKPSNGPGPSECGRVSCSWNAAIWWCNDNDHTYILDSFWEIAQGAQDIDSKCHYFDPYTWTVWTSGQNFFKENWNVIVRYDSDDC